MQTKLIVTTAVLLGLAAPAHAQLFTPGGTFNFNIQNSPGTSNNVVTFTPGTQLIDGGDVALTISVVNAPDFATTGAQWVVLQTQTVGGAPLSQPGDDWSISAVGLPAAVAINFIADYSQWQDTSGANIPQTNHIFNQPLISSPVPGLTGTGEGTSGFVSPIPVGPAFPLGAFSDPFSIVTNALGTVNVGGEIEALEFEPQSPPSAVPEPSTWAMMLAGFAGLAFLGYRQSIKGRLAA
ncbi:MAG: PEP-CTERM sorting domain-containing protein [Hyphomicrobiales bacterium]|nr:PEP-CTERM sorting domain-containing protein [Hyphomicrobiales bacterium]